MFKQRDLTAHLHKVLIRSELTRLNSLFSWCFHLVFQEIFVYLDFLTNESVFHVETLNKLKDSDMKLFFLNLANVVHCI